MQALEQTEAAEKQPENSSTNVDASGQQARVDWMSKFVNGINVWVNGK